jgi:hypothetical protein
VPAAVRKHALRRAIDVVGNEETVAMYLDVSPTVLKFWLNTSSPLPDDMFLKVVDLLADRAASPLHPQARSPNPEQNTSEEN